MKLELVVHCWAGQLPQYAQFLQYQMSSLILFPPEGIQVSYTVCCCPAEDPRMMEVYDALRPRLPGNVRAQLWPLERRPLMRRAIGRNEVSRYTRADVVWWGGCDYWFGLGCLDALADVDPFPTLAYPQNYMIHREHAIGDEYAERARGLLQAGSPVVRIDHKDFMPQAFDRAIGCAQIVPGDVSRKHGYLPGTKWQEPADTWQRTKEDPTYRKSLGQSRGAPIELPNLYRLRHTQAGRDV